jgi:LysR family cyn operon transcriptional activator
MLLRHIRYFLAVAEHGNFTRAAEALHVSQPTLSQQIRQLEDTLRTQLLDRSGRTVQLTDSGVAWMRYARLALQDLDAGARAIHDVGELSRGSLRLAITPTFTAYLIGPLVDRFYRLHPGISIDIREITQDQIEALLGEDKLDVGIAFEPTYSPEIEAQTIFTETLSLMVGGSHLRATRRKALTGADFEKEALVLLNNDFATRHYINQYCTQNGIRPRVAIEANSISAIVEIVRRGQLATVLPDQIGREHNELRPVPLEPPMPTRAVALLQRKGAYRSAASRAFAALLAEGF